jgi:ATP-binding cassette subfamily B protein
MKELAYLNKYLLRYKRLLLLGLLFAVLSNIFQIIPGPLVRQAIDLVVSNVKVYKSLAGLPAQSEYFSVFSHGVLICALLIVLMALLRGLFLYFIRQTVIVMSRHIEFDLKNDIFEHYQSLPLSFYRRNNTGDLMNRISEDVSRVRMYIGPSIMYFMQLATLFLMLIPIMFSINSTLTWYALSPLPLLSLSIFYVNNVIEKRSEEIQASQSRLSTFVQEAFSGIRVIKSFHRESDSIRRFKEESDGYKKQSMKLTRVESLFFPVVMALIGISIVLTIYAGSVEVIAGRLSLGNIAEFIIYVNLLTWPVISLGWTSSQVKRAEASQKRINEFLRNQSDILSDKNLVRTVTGRVEFRSVSFVYPDTGIQALSDVSFAIEPGESLAIIGTTGSGKSTVSNLLVRLYDTSAGEILIDDIPIRDYQLQNLRRQMGYVPQDVFLFSDTIYNNIAFGLEVTNEEKILQAARDADVYDNVMEFPQGFATRVGERGITLSGGQKQRVSIARAIVREPKILILDDALSAVDTKTENAILNSMKRVMQGRTTLIISHRVSSAKLASRILVLVDGRIAEQGTHAELLARNGFYQELFEKQMAGEEPEKVG